MTNPDLLYADEWPIARYGPKSITVMISALFKEHYGFDLKHKQYGKPVKATFDFAEKSLKEQAVQQGTKISNFYMIGDNPESDIAGANQKGWTSLLVKTGVFNPHALTSKNGNDTKNPASHVVEDFEKAINLIFKVEGIDN